MKRIKTTSIIAQAAIIAITMAGCKKEQHLDEPGNLVPKTVDLDPSLPSISVNGTQLHTEAFGNPNDPMVVYLHGGPGSDYRNAYPIKELTGSNYYVVFYDQRGSGLSKRHARNSYSIQVMLDDLSAVIDHHRTSTSQKVFLFGHSWGAMLAAAYINANPTRIDGVVFAEPGGFTDEMTNEYGELSRKLELLSEASNDAIYLDQFLTGGDNDHEILDYKLGLASSYTYHDGNSEGIEGPSPFWRKGAVLFNRFIEIAQDEGFDFTQNLHLYAPKVLFIYSELNKAYSLSFAQEQAAFFNQADIVQINGTGHEMIYFKWGAVHSPVLNYLNELK